MIKCQYTLYLANKPDAMTRITRILADAKVNIEGISVAESTDAALVQLVVGDDASARKALSRAKIPYTTQNVSVIVLPHRPGVLALLASRLQKAKTHINYVYATAPDDDSRCCLVISATDLKHVERIVRTLK